MTKITCLIATLNVGQMLARKKPDVSQDSIHVRRQYKKLKLGLDKKNQLISDL